MRPFISCLCAGVRFCSRRLFSTTLCFSCAFRSLNFLCGGVYADGGRFGLLFGRADVSARFPFTLGGRFAPKFCRSFCALGAACCCRRSCLCVCLCCCAGGLFACRFCAPFVRGPCANDGTVSAALIPSAISHPASWSFRFISRYICCV